MIDRKALFLSAGEKALEFTSPFWHRGQQSFVSEKEVSSVVSIFSCLSSACRVRGRPVVPCPLCTHALPGVGVGKEEVGVGV